MAVNYLHSYGSAFGAFLTNNSAAAVLESLELLSSILSSADSPPSSTETPIALGFHVRQLFVQAIFPHPFPPSFHCLLSVTGACSPILCRCSWLGLAATSEFRIQTPNLQLAMQLLIVFLKQTLIGNI